MLWRPFSLIVTGLLGNSALAEVKRPAQDNLVANGGFEDDESSIAFGGRRAIGDEQLIQHIEITQVPQWVAGQDGRLQVAA